MTESGWYPRSANTPAGRLAHYSARFGLVEVDTTYYALPSVQTTTAWAERTPPGFTFDVKAFSLFTGHPTGLSALPADLRPAGSRPGARIRRRDLPAEAYDELWARFHRILEPLHDAGRLGVLLLQFPPWLACGDAARDRVVELADRCRPRRVAVEFRHASWFDGANATQTLDFLRRHELSNVCVDMPQGHPSSVPPMLVATARPTLLRFHGHSHAWATGSKEEKFRYAYSDAELTWWADALRDFARQHAPVHVLLNNCCGGQAQRDAARLAELIGPPAHWSPPTTPSGDRTTTAAPSR